MLTSIVVSNKRVWIEYSLKIEKEIREFWIDSYTRVIKEENKVRGIEILGTLEEQELARMITRDVAYLMLENGLERHEIIKRIAETYGMDIEDAKQFFYYAESVLFQL